jgi:hypothetical protein
MLLPIYKFRTAAAIVILLAVSGCANTVKESPEFGDNWSAVNSFTEKIEVLPRFKAYLFNATQLDSTLIGLLTRWTSDLNLKTQFNCKNDFSLSKDINVINEDNINLALEKINSVYKIHSVNVQLNMGAIVFDCNLDETAVKG